MRSTFLLLGLVAFAPGPPAWSSAMFVPLGLLPGSAYSTAEDVSDDGSTVVGGSGDFSGEYEAFRWTQGGGMEGLGDLPGGRFRSLASAVSSDGSVIVGNGNNASEDFEAFRWTQGGGMVGLGGLPGAEGQSIGSGVSADGSIVVGSSGGDAFRWTQAGGMEIVSEAPSGVGLGVSDVSADGRAIVGCAPQDPDNPFSDREAFRWTDDGGMALGILLGDLSSDAIAVSADGASVVGWSLGAAERDYEAFRWTQDGGLEGLGILEGWDGSGASDVSGEGSVVVGWNLRGYEDYTYTAFIWDDGHGMRELEPVLTGLGLDLTGWTLEVATGISADGQTIVGWGTSPEGRTEAWLAIIPEPGTGALLAAGLTVLGARRRGSEAGIRDRRARPRGSAAAGAKPIAVWVREAALTAARRKAI